MSSRTLAAAAAVLLAACAPSLHTSAPTPVVVEQLHFGRNVKGEQVVSDSAWAVFLAEEVTPRFPDGFTAWSGRGQWRGADGRIEHEASYVLELVHPPSAAVDSSVLAIVAAYKLRFRQESVLRVVVPGRAAF